MSNQVGNNPNNPNFILDPNNAQMNAALYSQLQAAYTNQPRYVNGIDLNAARKRIMIISDKWRTREPMDGNWRASFTDCCWRQKGCIACCFPCILAQQIATPVCNMNILIFAFYSLKLI